MIVLKDLDYSVTRGNCVVCTCTFGLRKLEKVIQWKKYWTTHFQERRELSKLTGIAFNGMAHQAEEDAMDEKMISALDNLANTSVQKNNTFEQLVAANNILVDSLAARDSEGKKLLEIIKALSKGTKIKGGGTADIVPSGAAAVPWDPTGYCWFHGFKCKVGHNSATCKNRNDGHNEHLTATREDPQGGCTFNKK